MWLDFVLQNAHFAINLLAALVFFAVFWLLFDAWLQRKTLKEATKFSGFLLLALSFLVQASYIESTFLPQAIIEERLNILLTITTRILGYLLIIVGQLVDPLQPRPVTTGITPAKALIPLNLGWGVVSFPILALGACLAYLRRATVGLENHLKPVALSFFILSLAELSALHTLWQDTTNVDLYSLVLPFGPLWALTQLLLLVSVLILGHWVLGYLLKRLQTQLFMIFNIAILIIFLATTVSFTFLLLRNLHTESLRELVTDVRVLDLAIDSKKGESLSDAQVVAQNTQVANGVLERNRTFLNTFSQTYLLTKKQSFLVILDDNGQVLARGEDRERVGESLSEDSLVRRALLGDSATSLIARDGVLAPQLYVRSAAPIRASGEVLGVVLTGTILDNAFVDGIKNATGLETSLYGDNILSATTQTGSSQNRALGVKEENAAIKKTVLSEGKDFTGTVQVFNTPYLAAYSPLKDIDDNVVGMIFVGRPEVGVLEAAGRSIGLTFITTTALLILSIIPAFFIARSLARQLK